MALNADRQSLSKSEARWPLLMLFTRPFAAIGRAAIRWSSNFGASAVFLFFAILKIVRPKQVPKIIQQVYFIGAKSTMIIMLVGLFTGMVMGLQSYRALVKVGAEGALGTLVALSLIRACPYRHHDCGQGRLGDHRGDRYPAYLRAD